MIDISTLSTMQLATHVISRSIIYWHMYNRLFSIYPIIKIYFYFSLVTNINEFTFDQVHCFVHVCLHLYRPCITIYVIISVIYAVYLFLDRDHLIWLIRQQRQRQRQHQFLSNITLNIQPITVLLPKRYGAAIELLELGTKVNILISISIYLGHRPLKVTQIT